MEHDYDSSRDDRSPHTVNETEREVSYFRYDVSNFNFIYLTCAFSHYDLHVCQSKQKHIAL